MLDHLFRYCKDTFVYDDSKMREGYHWDTDEEITLMISERGKLSGICADFALYCRMKLSEAGVKNTLVFCTVENGQAHLVCSVDGDIFDNRQDHVVSNTTLESLGYKFLAESGTHPGDPWHAIT